MKSQNNTFNLELHRSFLGKSRHLRTVLWNIPYPIAKSHKNIYEQCKLGTNEYLKIVKNKK